MANIANHDTLADAVLDLHRQIVARWGAYPEIIDDLEIKTLPCADANGGSPGTVIAAWPRRTGVTDDNLLAVYYCPPQRTDRAEVKEA